MEGTRNKLMEKLGRNLYNSVENGKTFLENKCFYSIPSFFLPNNLTDSAYFFRWFILRLLPIPFPVSVQFFLSFFDKFLPSFFPKFFSRFFPSSFQTPSHCIPEVPSHCPPCLPVPFWILHFTVSLMVWYNYFHMGPDIPIVNFKQHNKNCTTSRADFEHSFNSNKVKNNW